MKHEKKFYVYEDWTLEQTPRCFYVGRGTKNRCYNKQRNQYHTHIRNLYGLDRKIVRGPVTHDEAATLECQLIAQHKTHFFGGADCWGANFSVGGEHGSYGNKQTDERRQKQSLLMRGKKKSPETRAKMSASQSNRSLEHRMKLSQSRLNKKILQSVRKKISEKLRGHVQSEETKNQRRETMSRPEIREKLGKQK